MRLAIATSREHANYHLDDAALIAALPARGLHPEPCVWNDPLVAWESYDAVLIRTIWDYFKHYGQFVAWLNRLQTLGVRTVNPLPILRWNADKRYLLALEACGVPTLAARICAAEELAQCVVASGWSDVVVKPTVSGGAWHTIRGRTDAPEFLAQVARLPRQLNYLVQPFEPAVARGGEWSLVYFGGEFSHSVLKRPASGEFRVQQQFGGMVTVADSGAGLRADGLRVLSALHALGLGPTMYARIGGVEIGGQLVLIEAELIEPQLFLQLAPAAAAHFARHLQDWLSVAAGNDRSASIGL